MARLALLNSCLCRHVFYRLCWFLSSSFQSLSGRSERRSRAPGFVNTAPQRRLGRLVWRRTRTGTARYVGFMSAFTCSPYVFLNFFLFLYCCCIFSCLNFCFNEIQFVCSTHLSLVSFISCLSLSCIIRTLSLSHNVSSLVSRAELRKTDNAYVRTSHLVEGEEKNLRQFTSLLNKLTWERFDSGTVAASDVPPAFPFCRLSLFFTDSIALMFRIVSMSNVLCFVISRNNVPICFST
jgi:hypothetical protein